MAFNEQDNRFVDFIRVLHARAPNLTASQILERCRINFGRHPPMQVQNWLYKSLGDIQKAREGIQNYINNIRDNPADYHKDHCEVAEKEVRQLDYFQRAIAGEFFGFTMSDHETTATAPAWGMKYLTDQPELQETLGAALRKALPDAVAQQRLPTYQEFLRASVP
ncbi:hypothetical protein PG985_008754 [Apiospora marii]|uniref:uncharacterized protein n=1 Tax=Apiospora marii TaxID=335849 RepID=UPI003131135B